MKAQISLLFILASIILSCHSPQKTSSSKDHTLLSGTWVLKNMNSSVHKFEELFAEKKPELTFFISDLKVSGNSSCNSFNGKFEAKEGSISFSQNMAMTKMFCPGEGEKVFMELLTKASSYSIVSGNQLQLFAKETMLLEFYRK